MLKLILSFLKPRIRTAKEIRALIAEDNRRSILSAIIRKAE